MIFGNNRAHNIYENAFEVCSWRLFVAKTKPNFFALHCMRYVCASVLHVHVLLSLSVSLLSDDEGAEDWGR